MSRDDDIFRDDYNLDALERIQPRGHEFAMFVTPRFKSHFVQQRFEPLTTNLIRSIARRKQLFIDVGAHYGFCSIVAGLQNPALRIHAIEPVVENCTVLRRNIALNGLSSVQIHEKAASRISGVEPLLKSQAADSSGFYSNPAAPPLEEIETPTLNLASLLKSEAGSPILVKIDTEGHEIPVLEGLEDSLSQTADATLIVEFNPEMQRQAGRPPKALLEKLTSMGFSTFLLQEDEFRLIRVDARTDYQNLVPGNGAANLYCRPRTNSLSVCFLSHSHALAGSERSLSELVSRLVADHGTVCNVVIPGEGPLVAEIEEAGAGVVRADYGWWCSSDSPTEMEIREQFGDDLVRFIAETLPQIETIRPDLISTNSMVIPYGAIAAALLRKPHLWQIREYGGEQDGYSFYLPLEQVTQCVEEFSEFIFTASKGLATTLFPHLAGDRVDHLYPHFQTPAIPDPLATTVAPSTSRPLRLLDLGALIVAKDQETDVRLVAELRERGRQVALLLKGPQDPQYVARLRELAEKLNVTDQVTIEEHSAHIWSLLDATDAVLVSAPTHSFGRTAAEGMLRAKPVVYPIGTDIAEYMEDGVTGLGYEAGDISAMADQVESLIRDPELGRKIGKAAHATATRLFTREAFSEKFLQRAQQLASTDPIPRPPLPQIFADCLVTGIQRLDRHSTLLEEQVQSRDEELAASQETLEAQKTELASIKPILETKEEELTSIKPVLTAREEELTSIKPVLAAREEELSNVKAELDLIRDRLRSLLSTRLGRLAAKLAKID